jgi:hypothetical protein
MRKLQHVPGIPNFADRGNPNVPLVVQLQFVLNHIYRVSQEECARLQESLPYVKVYRYNPKHLYPKLNGYRDNGQ